MSDDLKMYMLSKQRPDNYKKLSVEQQWDIDKKLGILDWEPKCNSIEEYEKLLNS